MCVDRKFKEIYDRVDSPLDQFIAIGRKHTPLYGKPYRVWRFDLIGLLSRRFDGLFNPTAWDTSLHPSWGNACLTIWNNVCQFLTPWFHPQRALIDALINCNYMKLLSYDRKSVRLRTRTLDCIYFEVRCSMGRVTARRIRYVDPRDGNGVCTFICGTAGTSKEDRRIYDGPCLTWKQCDTALTEIVKNSPELEWCPPIDKDCEQ